MPLTYVSLTELRALRESLRKGKLALPFTDTALQAAGFEHLREHLQVLQTVDTKTAVTLLDAVIAERESSHHPTLDLVWTGPEHKTSPSRDTAVVVREMFSQARLHVFIAGYYFYEAADIFRPLHESMKNHGVTTRICLDIKEDRATDLEADKLVHERIQEFMSKSWPFGEPVPDLYYDPRTARRDPYATLHAKCVVVDARVSLITSANFTGRAQTHNIEVGVRIDDEPFATALLAQWQRAIESDILLPAPKPNA